MNKLVPEISMRNIKVNLLMRSIMSNSTTFKKSVINIVPMLFHFNEHNRITTGQLVMFVCVWFEAANAKKKKIIQKTNDLDIWK